MSILFRTKGWLTVAQLARAWTAEILGAEQDPQQFEQELVHLVLEDIVNKRLDDAGPLAEGRRLGLRLITPDGRAGFLEGHQVRDLILPGGASSFLLNRIVVMKEAALDFARRHELPSPPWWTDAFAASTKPANHLAPDGTIRPIGVKPEGSKVDRMAAQSAKIEAGHVHLPNNAPWLRRVLPEALSFSKSRPHDTGDSASSVPPLVDKCSHRKL